jgi:hypothetical protein
VGDRFVRRRPELALQRSRRIEAGHRSTRLTSWPSSLTSSAARPASSSPAM